MSETLQRPDNYFYWKKGERSPLSSFFSTEEFSCQCAYLPCIKQQISKNLIYKLTGLRQLINTPISITSGFRCRPHQEDLRNKGFETATISTHECGEAADVRTDDLDALQSSAGHFFMAIGRAATFIHLDTRNDKSRFWTYKDYHSSAK